MSNDRYARQTVLPEIGEEGQRKLSKASVLCIGSGGLGSPALLYLAAAGVGHIGITDFDVVDQSNLQRQILFVEQDVGQSKVQQAKKHIQDLNPDIDVTIYGDGLNADNAKELFEQFDIILDCTDNFDSKFLINDAAIKYQKPWIYGAIQGFDGQLSVFKADEGPCYRCLYPAPPKAQIGNCAQSGVIGAVAGMIGVAQALQAIQLIVADESFMPLIGKLWTLDTKTMKNTVLKIPKNKECKMCSHSKDEIELQFKPRVCGVIPEISVSDLKNKTDVILIDVREDHEWEKEHIDGAIHWPLSKIQDGFLPDHNKDDEIVLHCAKGQRSMMAGQIMQGHGFKNLLNLRGGYCAWQNENH